MQRIRPGLHCIIDACRVSAALLIILVLILVLRLILALILVLILILVLGVHFCFLLKMVAVSRVDRLPRNSGFILGVEKNPGEKSKNDRCRDAACRGLQTAGEDPQRAFFGDGFLDALCKRCTEAG